MNELLKTYETAVALDKYALPWAIDVNLTYQTVGADAKPKSQDLVWCGDTQQNYQELGSFKQVFTNAKQIGWVVLVQPLKPTSRGSGRWRAVSLFGDRTYVVHPEYCEASIASRNFMPTVWDDMLGMFVDNPHQELSDHIHDQWRRGYAHWAVFRD